MRVGVVGTAEGCDLRVSDAPYLSNRHFALTEHDGAFYVEDIGSTNGTDVYTPGLGWRRATVPVRLVAGSKIYAGQLLFKISASGGVDIVRNVSLFDRDTA